ncbi:hypothetical protein ACFWIA_11135 [Streptomyces sp. NPDC127068]|uniref:hypothetical protein n=1 Tax=Streptomyces sp. NPDC127068 TaxID=3347127 RepID=UPI00365D46E8
MTQLLTWEPGTAVFDKRAQMVGFVDKQHGHKVILKRPSGLSWEACDLGVRVANSREKIQLQALARHHANATGLAKLGRYRFGATR